MKKRIFNFILWGFKLFGYSVTIWKKSEKKWEFYSTEPVGGGSNPSAKLHIYPNTNIGI